LGFWLGIFHYLNPVQFVSLTVRQIGLALLDEMVQGTVLCNRSGYELALYCYVFLLVQKHRADIGEHKHDCLTNGGMHEVNGVLITY